MRVLVIDDEPDVLMLCRVNLQLAGHEVLEASNGKAGLELARTLEPDVVVLDVMLPNVDGLTVLSELASSETTRHIPVIMLTAKTQLEDRRKAWRAGCTGYLTKPFSPIELVELVARAPGMSSEERSEHRQRALASLGA
jgi:two-component system, OmpR family, response regulator RpaA